MDRFAALLLAVAGLAVLLAAPARAAPRHIIVQDLEYPWSAVGRLNVANHSYCSAVMISERHLLTAAHCLWNRGEERWWPASAVRFVPGFQGEAPLIARLKSYVVADGYRFVLHPTVPALANDWAVAELDQPFGRQTGWLASGSAKAQLGQPAAPPLFGHAGYRQDHRYGLSLDYGCQLVGWAPQATVFAETCRDMPGDSGGPVLVFSADGPQVVGIVVATQQQTGQTLAVPLDSLGDAGRFPSAVRAAQAAGVGRNAAQAPSGGGPVAAAPQATLKSLGGGGQPASLAELTRLLAKTAGEGSRP